MKNNLPSYVSQLQVLRYHPKHGADALELLSLISKRIKQKTGKDLSKMSGRDLAQIPFDINAKHSDHKKFWGAEQLFSYEESAHFLGFFGKKHRDKRKKFFSNVGKGISNITKKIAQIVTAPTLVPLLPFVGAMKSALVKKGIKPEKGIRKIAGQFYNSVIKHYDYENYESYYAHLEGQDKKANVLPLATIIPAIISFFQLLFKKKEDGTATPEDEKLITEVAAEQKRLDSDPEYKARVIAENSLAKNDAGKQLSMPLMGIIALLVILVLRKV